MIKKHIILIGIVVSLMFISFAAAHYPGGSQSDPNSIGFDWKNNYLCNLFNPKAVNGAENPYRFAAIFGMLILCISLGIFFYRISNKVTFGAPAKIIKYFGIGSMIFAFLVVTPYHDSMTTTSSVLALVSLFYTTVFILKSKLTFFKALSVVGIAVLYFTNYIYYTRNMLQLLPIMQKVSFLMIIIWMLGLEYFTKKGDFVK